MRKIAIISFLLTVLFANQNFANNLQVSNVVLTGQNTASNFTLIQFDVGWDNSWRTSVGPSNYDAVWLFAKYRLKTSDVWNHATLHYVDGTGSGDGHTEPAGSNISSADDNGSGGSYGTFIYATADFAQANVSYTGVELRWDYGVDGLVDADSVEICLLAIEMVYIPQGNFFLGDGLSTFGQFEAGTTGLPFQVTSEGALTLGGGGAGSLGNNNATGMTPVDDYNDGASQALSAAFPKGFNDFYIMKYELSQEQYVGFLNKLTRTQQTRRMRANAAGEFMQNNATSTAPSNRNGVKIDNNGTAITPRVYGNDLNDNNVYGEAVDGQNIACNWVSTADAEAYLDWAGLRPITELEYEKVARGTQPTIAGEYAWGSTAISGATSITNSGANNELAGNAAANATYNNNVNVQGPLRVGQYAEAATTRASAGAGYYGVLDLTGNLWEFCIKTGGTQGRSFLGTHGDGVLDATGDRTNADWPSFTNGLGYGLRGGSYRQTNLDQLTISGRRNANWQGAITSGLPRRFSSTSCRGGRTAP